METSCGAELSNPNEASTVTAATAAQRRRHEIQGRRGIYFAGAYWGYGFHEDGVNSALAVVKYFDKGFEKCTAVSTRAESGTAVLAR